MGLRVVRAIGSGKCHVADVDDHDLMDFSMFGSSGLAVALDPVATVCATQLRKARGVVVVMTDAPVDCRTCARLSGIERVKDGEEVRRG